MSKLLLKIEQSLHQLCGSEKPLQKFKFLLAVSGGIDSMVMAHAFSRLNLDFGIAHFNFNLRGEDSEKDASLVETFCRQNHLPFHLKSEDTMATAKHLKMSIQETARHLRYQFFEKTCDQYDYDFICMAHHANDQLETFLIHFIRGSGLKGLTGIPEKRNNILRPLLKISLAEIEKYAGENHVPYRTDLTNLTDDYLRNKIRHHITEPLINWDDSYLSNTLKSMSFLSDIQYFINIQINKFKEQYFRTYSAEISSTDLHHPEISSAENKFLLYETLRSSGLYPDSIDDLLRDPNLLKTGSKFEGKDIDAFYDRGTLWLIKKDAFKATENFNVQLELNQKITLPGDDVIFAGNHNHEDISSFSWSFSIDPKQIELPMMIRHRQPGDRIWMGRPPYFRKSLKSLFSEKRIPLPFKDRIYILTDSNDQIISIPGFVNSPRFISQESEKDIWIGYHSSFWKKFDFWEK